MNSRISIDVVVDIVCPWCYIGRHRLIQALTQVENELSVDVRYHPFELNPAIPVSGVDHHVYLSSKFGGDDVYRQMLERVTSVARDEDLPFDLDRQAIMPNTRKMHILINSAAESTLQNRLLEQFYTAYFSNGTDLTSEQKLIELAVAAGMSEDRAAAALADADAPARIAASEEKLHRLGITGVPFYILQNKYGISGAQRADDLATALRRVAQEQQQSVQS